MADPGAAPAKLVDRVRASTATDRRRANTALAFLHTCMAVWGASLGAAPVRLTGLRATWNASGTDSSQGSEAAWCDVRDAVDADGVVVCQRFVPPLVFDTLDVTGLATLFFAITAAAHASYAWQSERYEALVAAQGNWWRWAEYALSVPPMLLIIAALNGMAEESGLFQGAVLGSVTQGFGYVVDTMMQAGAERRDALAVHVLGYIPMTAAFAPVIRGVHVLLTDGTVEPPSFVPFVIASQSLLFLSFGFVQLWYLLRSERRDGDYVLCESAYLLLSLVAKATLGGSILAFVALMRGDTS